MLQIAYHSAYVHPVREGHRFPMAKYIGIHDALLAKGLVEETNFVEPKLVDRQWLYLAHQSDYVNQLLDLSLSPKMVRRIGFPLTQELIDRELYLVDGTIQGSLSALRQGLAFNIAGGTHHAGYDFGEGFCLLNDQAVAASFLVQQGLAHKILIIDLDVHQGNGTAHIFAESTHVFTFSMHAEKNYPYVKEPSFLDVDLPDGMEDEAYLALLEEKLTYLFAFVQPDFVFYQAGVDVLASDKLGRLSMTADGCRRRDELVFTFCKQEGVPVQVSMGGGYSVDIQDIVDAHVATFATALKLYGLS
ncbi:histone deacetylase family protein [Sphingobacterium sp. MYb382]|uniref:histone deacetylase family protein n=1 Tax=Sphingobacterium sp. MYb382 TaxID=2745278 RepID=UPI00309F5F06